MRLLLLTAITMLAFAANSILCRLALQQGLIDAGSFSAVRLSSGAVVLVLCWGVYVWLTPKGSSLDASPRHLPSIPLRFKWLAGALLFGYAVLFSYAYIELAAGTGALLLFGAVQFTLLVLHWWQGNTFKPLEWLGVILSIVGFVWLMLPSATRPDIWSAVLMLLSGICWAGFTALGKKLSETASSASLPSCYPNNLQNVAIPKGHSAKQAQQQPLSRSFNPASQLLTWGFVIATLLCAVMGAILLLVVQVPAPSSDGIALALLSGSIASALGYLLWYHLMQQLSLLQAAVSQLSVPAIALLLGAMALNEPLSLHLIATSALILLGIALVFIARLRS